MRLKRKLQPRCVAPEIFEAIERALFLMENVDHDIGVIRHDPLANGKPVHRHGRRSMLLL